MSNYPKNRIYAIMTIEKAEKFLGDLVSVARKNIAGTELVWDWENTDPIIDDLKNELHVSLYTHDNILSEMKSPAWTSPEEE